MIQAVAQRPFCNRNVAPWTHEATFSPVLQNAGEKLFEQKLHKLAAFLLTLQLQVLPHSLTSLARCGVQPERHRAVVGERHVHVRSKYAGCHAAPMMFLELAHEGIEQRL